MRHAESDIQRLCVKWFKYQFPTEVLFSVPNGGFRNKVTAAIMKAEGAMAGVADLFLMKAAHGFNGLFIEMKTRDGRQSDTQKAFQAKCYDKGYQYVVCKSFEEFRATINDYLSV